MKKIWFGLGAIVIIILLLLQTRFNIFLELDNNGYAIQDKTVKTLLLSNPDEFVVEDTVPLCAFKPLDNIYTRANSYYLGEDKKTQIDITFPMLVNGGAGVWFIDDSSTLFDVNYDEFSTYHSLEVSKRIAYNPGGDRADADEYLFAGLRNGFFINLDSFKYDYNGSEREVALNSYIYFTKDYFTYCEQDGDKMIYQIARNMPQSGVVTVNGEELTYHQLLVNLHVISDKVGAKGPEPGFDEVLDEPIPTPEVLDTVRDVASGDEGNSINTDDNKKTDKEKSPKKNDAEASRSASGNKPSSSKGSSSKSSGGASGSGGSKGSSSGNRGVRPDSARPDKKDDDDGPHKKPVIGYVKPTVQITGTEEGIYRLMLDVKVSDPASRIDKLRKVQFEFYEQLPDGKEKLATRTYTGGNGRVTAGDGLIKPDTTYRVNVYFAYYNEYDQKITESVASNIMMTTGSLSDLGVVKFKSGVIDGIDYMSTPIYYDSYLKIDNVAYEKSGSAAEVKAIEEAVYGIDPRKFTVTIRNYDTGSVVLSAPVDSSTVNLFKRGATVSLTSASGLQSNSHYKYEITAEDFLDPSHPIVLENNTGEFYTCKARPQGRLELTKNEIGRVNFKLEVTDAEAASIKPADSSDTNKRDIYLVISTEKNRELSGTVSIWPECVKYINNGNQRVPATDTTPEGKVHYMYKLAPGDYTVDSEGKVTANLASLTNDITNLDLDQNYYAYLIADFDLQNNGPKIYQGQIGESEFTAAGLSSLGNIYVNVEIGNVTAHGVNIEYSLNETRTNDVLQELLHDVKFDIVRTNGDEQVTDSSVTFNDEWIKKFTGYEYIGGVWTYNHDNIAPLFMDDKFFDKSMYVEGSDIQYTLNSMTDYRIVPDIKATYNGKKYDMRVILSKSTFKTMKEPANVIVKDLIFAGGTLKFKVRVDDKDDAITGNSGHVVVMNLYDYGLHLKKSIRIPKNTPPLEEGVDPGFIQEVFSGLDPSQNYFINFIAVEYNEGYSNATYKSNEVLKRIDITDSLNITGTIKLQELSKGLTGDLRARTKVTINDEDEIMTNSNPYYVRVEKKTVDAKGKVVYTEITGSNIKETDYSVVSKKIVKEHNTIVDSNSEYRLTLYIIYNGNELDLDTLTFTTEREIVPINNAMDFVKKIKDNGANDVKYCITDDIDLTTYDLPETVKPEGYPANSNSIVSIFNGEIDFQGFKLIKDKTNDNTQIFNNIGPTGEIYNAVFEFSDNTSVRIYDEGALASRNYGHIHDVIVNYKGGSGAANQYYGLLCRINAASGIIERFVVNNDPEEGTSTFSARNHCGLVCDQNEGIVRDGYVYGEDINATTGNPGIGGDIYVGGIAGYQTNIGQMYNVYSLVNVVVSRPDRNANSNATDKRYGAVIGSAAGRIRNMYSIGQSFYNEATSSGKKYDADSIGPVVGLNVTSSRDVYYWNEAGQDYPKSTRQVRIGLESLYDYSWQQSLLGNQFDTQPVEVGYYPHVIMNEELPEQELLPLPSRAALQLVEIVGTEVKEYAADGNSAIVEFRLSNTRNAEIKSIQFENDNLLAELIEDEEKGYVTTSLDGYTTVYARVSDPKVYLSQYKVKSLTAALGKSKQTITYDPMPIVYVDFYRSVHNPQEWYDFVVKKPTENAKLANDIDFSEVTDYSRIQVTQTYTGKLDGNKEANGQEYGFTLKNITLDKPTASYNPFVFTNVSGEINNICIDNYTAVMSTKNNDRAGFISTLSGNVNNVQMSNITLKGKGYIGGLVCAMSAGAELTNCGANKVTIEYKEPANTNTNARIGGLVGNADQCHIRNCFVRDLDMKVLDIKNCEGAGGIVGYSNYCGLESLYATGDLEVRGVNVGGIVGYHYAGDVSNVMHNLIARVNVTTYQDIVGGLVGMLNLGSTLTERNNMTGVAFGNVMCKNTSSESVSYTVGNMGGYRGTFYGSDFQLFNGMVNAPKDENTYDLITYDEAKVVDTYTSKLGMTGEYDYSYVENGYIPHLYYAGTTTELPFQGNDPISLSKVKNNLINVKSVFVDEGQLGGTITLDLVGPEGYRVTNLKIEDLEYNKTGFITNQPFGANGTTRVVIEYYGIDKQKKFLDSYMLTEIGYVGPDSVIGKSDFSKDPVRIPLTLYQDIYDITTWNKFINPDNNYGDYQNYRITAPVYINFASGEAYTTNAKIGRLVGQEGKRRELRNITLNKPNENLIFRLNSEMSNLSFVNCNISASDRDCVGIVGTSAGEIYNIDFENVTINNKTSGKNFVGIVGYQISGCLGKANETINGTVQDNSIRMRNININSGTAGNNEYSGALAGYAKASAKVNNIDATDIYVKGNGRVGGLIGSTGKVMVENVRGNNFTVISTDKERVGGIIGSFEPGRTNSSTAGYFVNVTLTGTPVLDDDGYTASSTTTISFDTPGSTNSNYIGGLIGYSNCYLMGRKYNNNDVANTNKAEGIVVKGLCNYTGGLFGYCQDSRNGVCKDSLVTTTRDTTGLFNRMGGIAGDSVYDSLFNLTDHVRIKVKNHSYVGLSVGYKSSGNNTYQYNNVENSRLDATESGQNILYIGGAVGYAAGQMQYTTVYNSSVYAPEAENVGGVVGYLNHNMYRSLYYADPVLSTSPEANLDYEIKGESHVGGLVGYHNTGEVNACYSNANVTATQNFAGGLIGMYRNSYTVTKVNNKDNYSYSTVALRNNYFAGRVVAEGDFAGGLIGDLGLVSQPTGDAAEKVKSSGGRSSSANNTQASVTDMIKTGSSNEVAYTYRNMCLASAVIANNGSGHAYAFAGNYDGFEGKANYWNCGTNLNNLNQDKSGVDKAYYTLFWNKMRLNDTTLDAMTYDSTPIVSKNTFYEGQKHNNKRYVPLADFATETDTKKFNYGRTEQDVSTSLNCRLVDTNQLKTVSPYMLTFNGTWNAADNKKWKGGNYHVNLSHDVYSGLKTPYDTSYKDQDFLPHVRVNNNDTISDWLTQYQVEKHINLPVPDGDALGYSLSTMSLIEPTSNSMVVYQSDIDKINIEFADYMADYEDDQTDCNYFAVYYGGTAAKDVVDYQLIKNRVYTYTYDFRRPIYIQYGKAYLSNCVSEGNSSDQWFEKEYYDMSGDGSGNGSKIKNGYSGFTLAHTVMVYGTNYYYIDDMEGGVVTGDGARFDEDGEDLSTRVISGEFATIFNGKGLTTSGSIIDLDSESTVGSVTGIQPSAVKALQHFNYDGSDVKTYYGHSVVTTGGNEVVREDQILKNGMNQVEVIASDITNIKDSVVIYNKNGNDYLTVLGEDEIMIDLYQGEDIGAPEDFNPNGIVGMSNNFNTTQPYIVVEYSNSSKAGYNYMTGQYLFNKVIHNPMQLWEYFPIFASEEISELANVSKSAKGNAVVADFFPSSERLFAMVDNATGGRLSKDNNTDGETALDEESIKEVASFERAKTGDTTKLADKENQPDLEALSQTISDGENKKGAAESLGLEANGTTVESSPEGAMALGANGKGNGTTAGASKTEADGNLQGKTTGEDKSTDGENTVSGASEAVGDSNADGSGGGNGVDNEFGNGDNPLAGDGSNTESGTNLGDGTNKGGGLTELPDPTFEEIDNAEIGALEVEQKEIVEPKSDKKTITETEKPGNEYVSTPKASVLSETDEETDKPKQPTIESNIAYGKSGSSHIDDGLGNDEETNEEEEQVDVVTSTENLKLVFNMSTGTYEILDMDKFLTDSSYVSENARLGVTDFSAYGGYATEVKNDTDKEQKKGIALYILAAFAILAGVGGGIYYKKKNNLKV